MGRNFSFAVKLGFLDGLIEQALYYKVLLLLTKAKGLIYTRQLWS